MKISDLAGPETNDLSVAAATDIRGITSDSRKVKPGDLFVALTGTKADGSAFIADAVSRGAAAVVVAAGSKADASVPVIAVAEPRRFLALAAARFYGRQPETMVAVTGTAGKTSVASFTRQIWAHAGHAAAMIGTTGVVAPGRNDYGSLTTPDPVSLHELLAELAAAGVTHAAMEASSHGLDQARLDGVKLAAAAFTNLGRDHMDYHPTVEHYMASKMRLFDTLLAKGQPAVIYADDEWSAQAIDAAKKAGLDVRTVGRKGDYLALKRVEHFRHKQTAEIHVGDDIYEVHIPLAGDFQVANALVAAGLAMSTGVSAATAMAALEKLIGAAGRLELVGHARNGALAYVDYAHKPDALENVLNSVRPFTTGRVIVVFGCGGDRDKGKRPIMGEIATRLADVTIVTDDNPRSEVPAVIRSEIMAAARGATEIGDRAEAIRSAVRMLQSGDTLIVAGKGHEEGQTVGTVTLPFSDHAELRKALEELDR
ncbi:MULTISPECIES: UDP-N-acetylmuramoyl-L-alanyl-D-glutamate--2,6-diaminopimelate ligase [unclassified Shinella]|jgi:UDP-N-acetylmuramoyl-L-alanyl-D-glutamate--2,6-diaminopimelate ligase|uniref:UDP-N-acetylmuramoyl-L-alanyl-D-glutamate--2, 6-diaminopimelate ligase n=1 Tax=unclassified Shinella TaxID=2643062 RepID=UPI00067FE419|nr:MULTISPECIES: UDP-N-acetylmuramoyl-L-alanyl-D-glutamate--2,6-diaminopimelate ligase [unclassified Shinella]KNY16066.1 UDP-N-acetylmuramoylalanyl-D-glutamate--2,6-diaminopimelate ligase [Shinella sp. SUS2]KOC73579.1 UDP-N-acetylmuramoylalanyl-D-glutamate--2,6-diaminopimelate ligase [Shinella sp. GWS1]MCO5149420.1 UDP-N-acetylmuramoyl-L-alanyl-D-glutamate--2,6-diaminopimelate ligase [Shinella sp.]MDC7262675.1 UDP-N-acetylmuramoyl-L-alanyl-D-glutamate--2,6-diaminopimelate ligase [Shinella sp. H